MVGFGLGRVSRGRRRQLMDRHFALHPCGQMPALVPAAASPCTRTRSLRPRAWGRGRGGRRASPRVRALRAAASRGRSAAASRALGPNRTHTAARVRAHAHNITDNKQETRCPPFMPASTTLPSLVLNPPDRPPGFRDASCGARQPGSGPRDRFCWPAQAQALVALLRLERHPPAAGTTQAGAPPARAHQEGDVVTLLRQVLRSAKAGPSAWARGHAIERVRIFQENVPAGR